MPKKSFDSDKIERMILQVLGAINQPLRYNDLHRKSSSLLGKRIYIKTFNNHLKKLCEKSVVIRKERTKYFVTYELDKNNLADYVDVRHEKILEQMRDYEILIEVLRDPDKLKKFKELF